MKKGVIQGGLFRQCWRRAIMAPNIGVTSSELLNEDPLYQESKFLS